MAVPKRGSGRMHLAFFCLVWLAGCSAPVGLGRPEYRPETISRVSSERLAALRDFRADASIGLRSTEGIREQALMTVAFRPPDRLRIEVVSSIGISLMTVLARGDSLLVYVPSENRVMEGSSASRFLKEIAGLDLESVSPAASFLGIPAIPPDCTGHPDTLSSGSRLMVFICGDQRGVREIFVDSRLAAVTVEKHYDRGGRLLMQRILRGYRRVDSFPVPAEIEVTRGGGGAPIGQGGIGNESLRIRYTSVRINRGIHDDVFKLNLPRRVVRSPLYERP